MTVEKDEGQEEEVLIPHRQLFDLARSYARAYFALIDSETGNEK